MYALVSVSSISDEWLRVCSERPSTPPYVSASALCQSQAWVCQEFYYDIGGVAQWLESQSSNPKSPGFNPLAGFSVSPSQLLCRGPPPPAPLRTECTQICAHIKEHIFIRVGLTAGVIETRKHYIQERKKSWVAPY